jgi:biopolymer transport protein TolR
MAMTGSGGGNGLPMSDINVTPLVDVMLVLLIIFMVTAPHLDKGVDVELPEVQISQQLPAQTDQLEIKITKDGAVFLDGIESPVDKLQAVIEARLTKQATKEVFVRADKNVSYGVVVKVMAAARAAGVSGLSMVTEQEEVKAP